MYNIKITHYPDGDQISLYSAPICSSEDTKPEISSSAYENRIQSLGIQDVFPVSVAADAPLPERMFSERALNISRTRSKNRIKYLSRSNSWDWFGTFTFDPDRVNSFDYDSVTYALKKFLTVFRRNNPGVRYLMIPEQHASGRWHFHALFSGIQRETLVFSGHFDRKHRKVYHLQGYNLGFNDFTEVTDSVRVTRYIVKYITKELVSVARGKKRYWASRNLDQAPVEKICTLYCSDIDVIKYLLSFISSYSFDFTVFPNFTYHYFECSST